MRTADLIKAFRAAVWTTPAETSRFIREAGALPVGDVEKLLEVLGEHDPTVDASMLEARRVVLDGLLSQSVAKELFRPLVRALPAADVETRKVLTKVLPRCWDHARPDDVVQMFRAEDAATRAAGAELLGPVGGPAIITALSELLRSQGFPGRREAMDGLVKLLSTRVVPVVAASIPVLNEAEKLHALACLGDARVVGARPQDPLAVILTLFADPSDAVVVKAIEAYSAICSEDEFFSVVVRGLQSPRNPVVLAVIAALARFPSSARALDALEWKFKAGPVSMRHAVLDTLQGMAHERVIPVLAEALANPHILLRHRAADILGTMVRAGRVNLQQTILWLLKSPDANVRRMALEIALGVPDPEDRFWPDLLPAMGDPDWWVRQRTVDAVVALAGRKLLTRLPALTRSGSAVFRLYAVEALERLGDPEGMPLLVDLVEMDPDPLVKERALEAMGRMRHPQAVATLVNWMMREESVQLTCLEALRGLAPREASQEVATLLRSPVAEVRAAAIECLDTMDDARQLQSLEPLLRDEDARVRRLAEELFDRWESYGSAALEVVTDHGVDKLLERALDMDAEVLVVAGGSVPLVRRLGQSFPLMEGALSSEHVNRIILPLLGPRQHHTFSEQHEVDTSYELRSRGRRFRLHVFSHLSGVTAVFQFGRSSITPLDKLGLPDVVKTFGEYRAGLVLVAGPSGGGKSTSIHGMLQHVNLTSTRHVITLENAIEVVHQPSRSIITQRELGRHARDLQSALKGALREDPDIIVIDDLRDFEAISFALTAAETGHLVLGALQITTPTAQATLERFIRTFPPGQQEAVQAMIAGSLRAVLCQKLMPTPGGASRIPVVEVLINTPAVANLIRKGKVQQVGTIISTSADAGMQLMDADIQRRLKDGSVVNEAPQRSATVAVPAVTGLPAPLPAAGVLPAPLAAAGPLPAPLPPAPRVPSSPGNATMPRAPAAVPPPLPPGAIAAPPPAPPARVPTSVPPPPAPLPPFAPITTPAPARAPGTPGAPVVPVAQVRLTQVAVPAPKPDPKGTGG